MATSIITNTITGPTGTALANIPVIIRLAPKGAFRSATGAEVAPQHTTTTDASGIWSATLERNSGITPANSFYVVEEQIPDSQGGARRYAFQVGASNQTLLAALVTPIPDLPANTYLTQTAADARYVQSPLTFATPGTKSMPGDAASAGAATSVMRSDATPARETVYATAAARAALSSPEPVNGQLVSESDTHRLARRFAGAWEPSTLKIICTSGTRPTSVAAGQEIFETDTLKTLVYDGTSWWTTSIAGNTVQTWTPQVDQGATVNIAKTVTVADYRIVNGVCDFWYVLAITGAGTAANVITITLPVTASAANSRHIGHAYVLDASVPTIDTGTIELTSTTQVGFAVGEGTNNLWGATPNIALAAGDSLRGHGSFRVATAA